MGMVRNAAVAGLAALAMFGTAPEMPVLANGLIEQIAPVDPEAIVYPGQEPGAMRDWVQLVWDPATEKLVRRTYSVFDPMPSLGLDLAWDADDLLTDRAGAIGGRGVLTFRRTGAASYDPAAAVAQFRGTLVDGRPEGFGTYLHVSGFSYAGQWHEGMMHGQGRLSLPNGDQYAGAFAAGRPDGAGIYVDATGALYDGRFADGLRDGTGLLVPAEGQPYEAAWMLGQEVAGSRLAVNPDSLDFPRLIDAQYTDYDDLRIGIVAERRPVLDEYGLVPLSYTSRSDGQTLAIYPDDERLLGVWRGTLPLQMTDREQYEFDYYPNQSNFLGLYIRFQPLALVFEVENEGTAPLNIVGGYLDVSASTRDPEPAIQLWDEYDLGCDCEEPAFEPAFRLQNYGWSAAENAEITHTFSSASGDARSKPFTIAVGEIAPAQNLRVDLIGSFASLGVDAEWLDYELLTCTDWQDAEACLKEVQASGRFGDLADYLSLNGNRLLVTAEGTLAYDWTDAEGTTRHKVSEFLDEMLVGIVANGVPPEMGGEGGDPIPVLNEPFLLEIEGTDYRVPIGFTGDVAAGATERWRIQLTAEQTSVHDFRLVLLLADGREVASRPIHFEYFLPPKTYPEYD